MSEYLDGITLGSGISWKDGKKIAVMITFDFDGPLLRESRAVSKGKHIGFADHSRGMYGIDEGIYRCLNLLKEKEIHTTFFIPGKMIEDYPEIARDIHKAGHEISYHGYNHESVRGIDKETEIDYMDKAEALIKSITGKGPKGHRGPESIIHPFTYELMAERDYIYSSSMKDCDYGYVVEAKGKKMVELPTDIITDDFTYFYFTFSDPANRSMYTNREVISIWKNEFDALAEEGDKIFVLKLHPQLIGRLSRLNALGDFIDYMKDNGAWIASCQQVAEYILSYEEGTENNEI